MEPPADPSHPNASPGHDPELLPLLRASDAGEADRLLADLLAFRVVPTIRDVVRRILDAAHRHTFVGQDVDDVSGDAVARVLRALGELRTETARAPIRNLEAYAARVATHACHEYFRRRYPERARLRNRIWYVMARDPALTLERAANGAWIAGLAGDHGLDAVVPVDGTGDRSLRHVVHALVARHGRTIDLNDLVNLVAQELGVRDAPADARSRTPDVASVADPGARPPLDALEQVEYLRRLWIEVQDLPLRQRTALLLNLRDASGGDALDLLPLTGTASLREIARVLDLDAEELAQLWPELPLDDNRIAERLSVSRQQVINLRKAARARLGRRMAAFETRDARAIGNTNAISDSRKGRTTFLDT